MERYPIDGEICQFVVCTIAMTNIQDGIIHYNYGDVESLFIQAVLTSVFIEALRQEELCHE